ncbi:MAG: glycosyltransferase [Bacteroidetes bacterium]|nr:glycosyltransferase [Bacteroidota bacterium]
MKIMLVADMLGYGGREKVVIDLANGLCAQGHEVLLVTLSHDQNEQAHLLNGVIKFFQLPATYQSLGGIKAIGAWIKCLPAFIKLLKAEKPDIVHTHVFFQRLLLAAVAIKFSGIKARHYHTIHTSGLFYKETGFINHIRLQTERLAVKMNRAFLIAISKEVYENIAKPFKRSAAGIALIYNGVDDKQFDYSLKGKVSRTLFGLDENKLVVTYLARITEGKDHITLLKAWKMVAPQAPRAILCLAGDGELKLATQEFCRRENLEQQVVFLGTVKDVPKLLAVTDVAVFTSLFEGFGIAVFEQMLMKIPMVSTNIRPVSDFILPNENGFLFAPGDATALATFIIRLINDGSLRERIGGAGYKTAQQFSMEKMIRKHEEAYAAV